MAQLPHLYCMCDLLHILLVSLASLLPRALSFSTEILPILSCLAIGYSAFY